MAAKLSTHVLNLVTGRPAAGMRLELWFRGTTIVRLKEIVTNQDGRTDVPLLAGDELKIGGYEIVFSVKDYFASMGMESVFLDEVPIRFSVVDPRASYHVPLLVTPWSYSTYRGS